VHSQKILAFSDFLARPPKSYNEIAQFLVMNTFMDYRFENGLIMELTEEGLVCPIGGFGWPQIIFDASPNYPISGNLPLTNAIREKQIIVFQNAPELTIQYPEIALLPAGWVSGIVLPAYPIGCVSFLSSERFEIDREKEIMLTAIGSLLGLYASRLPVSLIEVAIDVKKKIDLPQVPLTDRQLVIAGMLERGFNNAQIGLELGYSESLIRQETVAIYRKLEVTGRKAMQAISALRLDAIVLDESV
jgi:DNA-binding CsgD family transcriptional regulator